MSDAPLDRRKFAATLAAGVALVGCGTAPTPEPPKAIAQPEPPSPKAEPETVPPPVEVVEPAPLKPEDSKPLEPGELLLELVKAHYADERLEDEHLKMIRRDLERQLHISRELSSFGLKNWDEPAPVFSAYRGPG